MTTSLQLKQAERTILVMIVVQGALLAFMFSGNPGMIWRYLGLVPGQHGNLVAWVLALFVAIAYVWSAASVSVIREWLFRVHRLKFLSILLAILAGVLEEVIFRKVVMDALLERGSGPVVQVIASGVAFGLVHAVWGFKSVAAGVNAVVSTTILGAALAIVYIVGDRSLAPCVVAHILITGLIEPGLIVAAIADRLGVWKEKVAP
jgi:membrane protease YdiL (CAAX protease family)